MLLWASFLLGWAVGGTSAFPPHWYYLPVLLAAARFGTAGALITGLAAGALAGPLTPGDVVEGTMQPVSDWTVRAGFFVVLGAFFAHVVRRTQSSVAQELEDLRLHNELAVALETSEIFLEYQPVVDLRSREVIGVEALVRWDHPDRGRTMPDEFIPQAEASGQILALGNWVIEEACRQLGAWRAGPLDGTQAFRLSVNVSSRQLEHGDLAGRVERALRRHRIPPHWLVIELTESSVMTEHTGARRQLKRLRDVGVHVAVDDFGTGYSSLAYLRDLPVDIVKIDRAFVQRLGRAARKDDRRIAAGIIDLARDLGMDVVAEGIEDEGQADMVLDLGCRWGQGFLFAHPLSPGDAMAMATESPTRSPLPTEERPDPPAGGRRPTDTLLHRALSSPDTTSQHQARTTALAALFLAGACMALTVSALSPIRNSDNVVSAALGASGFPMSFLLLRYGPRLPTWSIHAFLFSGTAVVTMGALLARDPGLLVATCGLYLWVVLYAAAFYDWPVAAAHFAVVAGSLTAVLTLTETDYAVGVMVMLLGTAGVSAGVVGWLARQLRAVASTDLLTGLPNRQAFEALLPREIARALRHATPLCVAIVDVDGFKAINDTLGHQAGDEVLATLPRAWQSALRDGDVIARVGGDEFVVLLPDCRLEHALTVLERMAGLAGDVGPTCSVGVAELGEGEVPEDLLARADRALYEAKATSAGCVVPDGGATLERERVGPGR